MTKKIGVIRKDREAVEDEEGIGDVETKDSVRFVQSIKWVFDDHRPSITTFGGEHLREVLFLKNSESLDGGVAFEHFWGSKRDREHYPSIWFDVDGRYRRSALDIRKAELDTTDLEKSKLTFFVASGDKKPARRGRTSAYTAAGYGVFGFLAGLGLLKLIHAVQYAAAALP